MDKLEQTHIQQITDLKIQFAKITSEQDERINQLKRELAKLEKTRMELSNNESQKNRK